MLKKQSSITSFLKSNWDNNIFDRLESTPVNLQICDPGQETMIIPYKANWNDFFFQIPSQPKVQG